MHPESEATGPAAPEQSGVVRRRRRHRRKWWSPKWLWRHRPGTRRPAARSHSAKRRRKLVLTLLAVFAGLLLLGGVSAWLDVRHARAEIADARERLTDAVDPSAMTEPEGRAATRAAVGAAADDLASAHRRIGRSPALWAVQFVPALGDQRDGLLVLLDDARRATATAGDLVDRVQAAVDIGGLRDGVIPFDSLDLMAVEAERAATVFRGISLSRSALWGPLASARRDLDELAASTDVQLTQAAETLGAARSFLGGSGDRRYLLAMQNNAEMRDQGMVLSYAVVHFGGGRITFERQGPISDLALDGPTATPIPPGTQEVFGITEPTTLWQSVNSTADFDWSGRAMVDMYRQATGSPIDGVVTLDVPGLAALLRVVGPVEVPGLAGPVSAGNAGRVLLNDLYKGLAKGDDQGPRREALGAVADAVITRLTNGNQDLVGIGSALAEATTGGHLRVWSAAPTEQEVFLRAGISGGPARVDADRTFHVAVENRTGTKLDYFVKPSVRQEVRFSGRTDVVVRTTVVIDNQAPTGQPPSYQLGPDQYSVNPGDYTAWVLLWGPAGANQQASIAESGLTLSQAVVKVGAGERREAVFDTLIPGAVRNGELTVRLVPQPRLEPVDLSVTLDPQGRKVEGATSWNGPWDRTRTLSWQVE